MDKAILMDRQRIRAAILVLMMLMVTQGLCQGNPLKLTAGSIVSSQSDGKHKIRYHVFAPANYQPGVPLPMCIAFSPGGGGRGMVNNLRSSMAGVGWICVGVDKLRNGMEAELKIEMEDEVLPEILKQIPHTRLYYAGMSGGAMRCFQIAGRRKETVTGILSYGGWLGGSGQHKLKLPYCKKMRIAFINGDSDKNANGWIAADSAILRKRQCETEVFHFPGGHVMAPSSITDKAIAWMEKELNETETTELKKLYSSRKYAEAYQKAYAYSLMKSSKPQTTYSATIMPKLKTIARKQLDDIKKSSSSVDKIAVYVKSWGTRSPYAEEANKHFVDIGKKTAESIMAKESKSTKQMRWFLEHWGKQSFANPVRDEFDKKGVTVLAKLDKGKTKTSTYLKFVNYWSGCSCTKPVIERLKSKAEQSAEKLLSSTGPKSRNPASPQNIIAIKAFLKKWNGFPATESVDKRFKELAASELSAIKAMKNAFSKRNALRRFIKSFSGTPEADEAKKLLKTK
jgi:hypothetical protein